MAYIGISWYLMVFDGMDLEEIRCTFDIELDHISKIHVKNVKIVDSSALP